MSQRREPPYHPHPVAPLLFYLGTAALLLWLAHRHVRKVSRRAALLLVLLPFAFCGWALIAGRVYAPIDLAYESAPLTALKARYGITNVSTGTHTDVYTEFIPWRKSAQWSLARGEWGLWNPFAMAGEPLLATQQPAVVSPLTLLAVLMPVALSFTFTAAITFFIAALCAFLFARELECGESTALIAAAGWAFCTPIALFLLVTMGQTWAWCPLLLLAVRRVVEQPSLPGGALLTFAFTAILYSGHPESAVLCVLVGLLYGLFEMARVRGNARRALVTAITAAGVALLLSAIHLLPFLEVLPRTSEHALREAGFVDAPPATPLSWSLMRIALTLLPYLHERPWTLAGWTPQKLELEIGAVGSLILALAVYGAVRVRSATSHFLAALGIFSLLVYAEWAPLVAVLRAIPVLEMTLTDRLSFSFALSACVLAAMGAQQLRRRSAIVIVAVVFVLVAAGNWWATRTPLVMHGPLKFGEYKVLAEVGVLAAAVVCIGMLKERTLPAALLALVIVQRVLSDGGLYHSFSREQAYPPVPLFAAMRGAREPFRVVGTGNHLLPQMATMYELEDVRGVPSLALRAYAETYALWCTPQPVWFQRVDDLTRPFLSFLNVRYAISDQPAPPGWRELARDGGVALHENTRVLPRAFLPESVSVGYPRLWNYADLLKETDFAARAWIEAPPPGHVVRNPPGRLAIERARLGYTIRAEMSAGGWIVTSIPNWPGWRATLDGEPAPVHTANHAFVGLRAPAGRHVLRLTYWPRSFTWGCAISGATAALVALALLARKLRA